MKIKLPTIALAALLFAGLPLASSSAYVGVSVAIAPPAIPVYQQPYCPGPGYIWTPGYWDYAADGGYYWVPGVWVQPPSIGVLWTPGYWGYNNGLYVFNSGYWGPTIGFYGGINYGYGYGGHGYYGGRWSGNNFQYNTAVTRVNNTVINNNYTYVNKNVNATGSRAGFNGPGGAKAQATAAEKAAGNGKRIPPTSVQQERVNAAKNDPALRVKNNKGKPSPEAVQALNRKTGVATAANPQLGEQNGNKKQAHAENQGKNRNQTNAANGPKTANQTKSAAKTKAASQNAKTRNAEHNYSAQKREKEQFEARNHHVNSVANPVHPGRQPQAEAHRTYPTNAQKKAPVATKQAQAPTAQQKAKKKKKGQGPNGQGPNGQ